MKTQAILSATLAVAMALFTVQAMAQTRGDKQVPKKEADKVIYPKVQHMEFDNDTVEGTMARPDGELVSGSKRVAHRSLLKIRATFHDQMLKSAENF